MTEGYTDSQTLVDMKNNVFYNWGDKAGYGSENGAKTYIQNNVYRPGPATPQEKESENFRAVGLGQKYKTDMFGSVYAAGNIIDVEAGDAAYATAAQALRKRKQLAGRPAYGCLHRHQSSMQQAIQPRI